MDRLKNLFDAAVDSHPLTKGAAGGTGALMTWLSDTAHVIDPIVRGISFYGGAVVVILAAICWCLDMRRKWKHRND